jgi:hypothetical protein
MHQYKTSRLPNRSSGSAERLVLQSLIFEPEQKVRVIRSTFATEKKAEEHAQDLQSWIDEQKST